MTRYFSLLAITLFLLGGCAVYLPPVEAVPVQGAVRGGPGNGFCPPGQAKKGNC